MSKRFYPRYFIALADMVKEWLYMSENGFKHLWDLHRAFFYMEAIVFVETRYGFVRNKNERFSLTFERQDYLNSPYPVCAELPDTLARMEACREIVIDRSPMFPLEESRQHENHFLRFSRPVLRRPHKPLKISPERRELMQQIINNICYQEPNNISTLPWERLIRMSAAAPGDKIGQQYMVLLRPPEPVRAMEQVLSDNLLVRKVTLKRSRSGK